MAENSEKYLDPQTLASIQGLKLRARNLVEGYVAGLHRSPLHGFSIEFSEHREYVPGDDLRYVDWKLYGRTDKYYLKRFEDETNLICYIVLDVSESMRYKSHAAALSKLEYAQCVAAALAWLVLKRRDAVGLVTFDDEIRQFASPSSKPGHVKQILHVLETSVANRRTSTGPVFHELAERFRKRGLVLVLSDLLDDIDNMAAGLKHFRHRQHDVILFQILDPAEIDFPFGKPTRFRGLEKLPEAIANPRALRKAYLKQFSDYRDRLKRVCQSQRIDYELVRTDQRLDAALSDFLSRRMRQVQ